MRRRKSVATTVVVPVPRALLIGPCVDVWAADDRLAGGAWSFSAHTRFAYAREAWLEWNGQPQERIPARHPWTLDFLSYRGQAERVGRPVAEIVGERLAKAGCTLSDIPALRAEATRLADPTGRKLSGSLARAYEDSMRRWATAP